jgi:hypothetical protein
MEQVMGNLEEARLSGTWVLAMYREEARLS